jgi:phosphate transport system substrate-binding protein
MSQNHLHHRLAKWTASIGVGALCIAATLTAPASAAETGVAASTSVDFVVLTPTEAKKGDGDIVQAPRATATVALAYNLPGIKGRLNLPKDVYADIFLGKIRSWNDPRIRAANKDLNLPAITIAVACRQDPSEATFAFTNHLAAVSAPWAAGPGVGQIIEWPHFVMLARGNEGVASRIKISEGSIGYIEYGFARRLGLQMAALDNKDEQLLAPAPLSGATDSAGKF